MSQTCAASSFNCSYSLASEISRSSLFFFQAEDGIRDRTVTGVQTCALPIFPTSWHCAVDFPCLIGDRWAQHEPVVVTFSKPIYQLVVYSGDGSFTCAGTYGTLTAYNRVTQGHGGQQVEQRDFVLQFPEVCGYDQQT